MRQKHTERNLTAKQIILVLTPDGFSGYKKKNKKIGGGGDSLLFVLFLAAYNGDLSLA